MSIAPDPTKATTSVPDPQGRFGKFGGRFVPETLTRALEEPHTSTSEQKRILNSKVSFRDY